MAERPPRRLDSAALYEYALRALGARAHSTGELREKLARRAADPADVPAVLARLKQFGYLDDRRFAESYSTARLENDGFGKSRVVRDLRRRRIAPALAEEAVANVYRGADEVALIEDFLRRKFRNSCLEEYLAEPKHLAAAYRRLRGAGFTSGNAIRVLKRFAADADLLDTIETPEQEQE